MTCASHPTASSSPQSRNSSQRAQRRYYGLVGSSSSSGGGGGGLEDIGFWVAKDTDGKIPSLLFQMPMEKTIPDKLRRSGSSVLVTFT